MKNYLKIIGLFLLLSIAAFAEQRVIYISKFDIYPENTSEMKQINRLLQNGWKVIHVVTSDNGTVFVLEKI